MSWMYLKTLKAYGFKSFADKIEINFEKNINGIVGPNGSGKSNVVDAVRWVLGEQSIKSLRGDTSTDVIFSGSKSRKALNSASVTLIFDNSDFYLPIQYTEVSVKRIMYRSGENEYYLNNERCRLKDITNLLVDTGADKESFNIISQGKIDEILSTKPADRRSIFESAAGVIKYKKRKEEAQKKLERTNLNIDRVNDILNELEQNLIPLKKQSESASKYLEIKDELSNLSISLMASDITKLNHETKFLEEKTSALKDEIVKLSNNNSSYDVELIKNKQKLKSTEDSILEHQNTLIEMTKNIEKINADMKLLKLRMQYSEKNTNQEEENLLQLKEEILKKNTQLNEIKNKISSYQEKYHLELEKKKEEEIKQEKLLTIQNKLTKELEQNDRNILNLEYKIEHLENNIENNASVPSPIRSILNNKRLKGKHNIVGNLLTMDKQYQTAITIALSSTIHHFVVDTTDDAKEMVSYLKQNQLGRATFLPIDAIKPRAIDSITKEKIKKQEGFVGIASSLVQYDEIYTNIIANLLGNIIICTNLEQAILLSKSILGRYKIVTLDGQTLNIGGSITGGSVNKINNLIKEKYDLEESKLNLAHLKQLEEDIQIKIKEEKVSLDFSRKKIQTLENSIYSLKEGKEREEAKEKSLKEEIDNLNREIKNTSIAFSSDSNLELENMLNTYYKAISSKDELLLKLESLKQEKENISLEIKEIEDISKQDNANIQKKEKELSTLELKRNTLNMNLDNLLITLGEEYNLTYEAATSKYKLEIEEDIAREKLKKLKNEMKELGYVNIEAINEYKVKKERYDFLTGQKNDLQKAEETLLKIMKEMDDIMKEKFLKTFESIRLEFKKVFKQMFRGGEAELILTDPSNLLETGIEIEAIPSGKNLKSITLLSGGEKTFTAISLLFAILNVRSVPFCLLDEVEAALDDANVESFGHYLNQYRDKTQFILITHKKKTMEFASTLYGITMQESGVSKLVSVKLEEISKE